MAYFLAKTDPETYSIDQLEKEKRTIWDGVNNPQAVRAIREMRPGDKVFIYHSGGLSAVVGMAKVMSESRPDPKNPRSAVADFEYLGRIDPPVALGEIKQSKLFDDWALVRQGRLSTMSAPEKSLPSTRTSVRRRWWRSEAVNEEWTMRESSTSTPSRSPFEKSPWMVIRLISEPAATRRSGSEGRSGGRRGGVGRSLSRRDTLRRQRP